MATRTVWRFVFFLLAVFPSVIAASPYDQVEIAPARTSVFGGSVSLTIAPLAATPTGFASTYRVRVVPFFFLGEKGQLSIELSPDQLQQLATGVATTFVGRAENKAGEVRHIEGRADPIDDRSGNVSVRIVVSKHSELNFQSTYRFSTLEPKSGPAGWSGLQKD